MNTQTLEQMKQLRLYGMIRAFTPVYLQIVLNTPMTNSLLI